VAGACVVRCSEPFDQLPFFPISLVLRRRAAADPPHGGRGLLALRSAEYLAGGARSAFRRKSGSLGLSSSFGRGGAKSGERGEVSPPLRVGSWSLLQGGGVSSRRDISPCSSVAVLPP